MNVQVKKLHKVPMIDVQHDFCISDSPIKAGHAQKDALRFCQFLYRNRHRVEPLGVRR